MKLILACVLLTLVFSSIAIYGKTDNDGKKITDVEKDEQGGAKGKLQSITMMNNQEGPDAGDSYDEFQKKAAAFRGMDLSGTSKHKSEYDDKIGGIIINKGNVKNMDKIKKNDFSTKLEELSRKCNQGNDDSCFDFAEKIRSSDSLRSKRTYRASCERGHKLSCWAYESFKD